MRYLSMDLGEHLDGIGRPLCEFVCHNGFVGELARQSHYMDTVVN